MDHSYDTIEAHICYAKQLRSEALGELLGLAWKRLARFFADLAHRGAGRIKAVANRPARLGLYH